MTIVRSSRCRLATSLAAYYFASAIANPSAVFTEFPVMVYNWTRDHCPDYPAMPPARCVPDIEPNCDPDIPDACTRVWAAAVNGSYHMLGSVDGVSRAQLGSSLDDLVHSCGRPYANATYDSNLSQFRDHEWIEAPVVLGNPGGDVFALTHVDSYDEYNNYLYTSVTLFSSSNGGATFAPAREPPGHLVASTPYDNTNLSLGIRGVGFGMPSSILRHPVSGLYYALVLSTWGETVKAQRGGLCLMRTSDITDPTAWRAWNGEAFNVTLNVSPLLGPVMNPDAHTCTPLVFEDGSPIGMRHLSLLWSSFFNSFLLFGEAAPGGALNSTGGWCFSLSSDLIHWGPPVAVDAAGMINPAGNATLRPRVPMPGRFIKAPGAHTSWEEPGGAWKTPVGSCEPCPGLNACDLAVNIPVSEFDAIANSTVGFECTLVYSTSGYINYVYSVLVDDSAHRTTGRDPSFNIVGQDAHIFFVAKKCAGVEWDHTSVLPTCTPLDDFARDERDIVRAAIRFSL